MSHFANAVDSIALCFDMLLRTGVDFVEACKKIQPFIEAMNKIQEDEKK